ncbi:MAG: hypothetical protein Q9181_006698 [Wetmoreana brouardii]
MFSVYYAICWPKKGLCGEGAERCDSRVFGGGTAGKFACCRLIEVEEAQKVQVRQADNYGAVVNLLTWFLMVATILAVMTRFAMKWAVARKANLDDAVILAATAFCIAESIAISIQVQNGLGQHVHRLTASQRDSFQKAYYASALLYIPCVCLSKVAVALLLRALTPIALHKKMAFAIGVFTVAWSGTAELAMAFQCKVPHTWDVFEGQCFDSVGTLRLLYFGSAARSHDITFNLWPTVVCTQIVQSLSIITACVPYLKHFFDSLKTGMIRSDDVRRRGLGPEYFSSAPMSRMSPGSDPVGDTWLAAKPVEEAIKMDTQPVDVPGRSGANDGGNDVPSSRGNEMNTHLSAIGCFPQSPASMPSTVGCLCDSDSQTSPSRILQKISRPIKAKALPPRG